MEKRIQGMRSYDENPMVTVRDRSTGQGGREKENDKKRTVIQKI